MIKDLHTLPANLPVPVDDGACNHLPGITLPSISLTSTAGRALDLSACTGAVVIYFYPLLGRPDSPPLIGWNEIPGARGCTPQTCAFRDFHAELKQLGAQVFGVSAQRLEDQYEAHARLHLPFELLNDGQLALAQALQLPTFEYAGTRLIKRLTIVASDGLIRKVFYPVFPPDNNAREVIAWLRVQQV
ncbi:MAG: peroxiredoxin [Gammaproteobacteria bacterium]|nr:peroxiredoxin [Gammaproteobacteria bacterium]